MAAKFTGLLDQQLSGTQLDEICYGLTLVAGWLRHVPELQSGVRPLMQLVRDMCQSGRLAREMIPSIHELGIYASDGCTALEWAILTPAGDANLAVSALAVEALIYAGLEPHAIC